MECHAVRTKKWTLDTNPEQTVTSTHPPLGSLKITTPDGQIKSYSIQER